MIQFNLPQKAFVPGETIAGQITWQTLENCDQLHVRLIWYTSGKGDQDFAIVQQKIINRPPEQGRFELAFVAPEWPHSFSGKLITLSWAIEVVRKPSNQAARCDLIIGPEGKERAVQWIPLDVTQSQVT